MKSKNFMSMILIYCSLILSPLLLQGCASIAATCRGRVDYEGIKLLNSEYMVGETDVFNGKVVFSANVYNTYKGDYLAFYGTSIFVSNTDSSNQKLITPVRVGVHDLSPRWTKNGDLIFYRGAYNSWGPTQECGHYFIDMDGDEVKGITRISEK